MREKTLTLGSLFDGSGCFPLGGILAGIEPKWGAEIEPFPVLVTHKRLPQMKHYGDVSALSGHELEPVDIITLGSPCQDLCLGGSRAGIKGGERSGLFFQAIRIIKEMREETANRYPRYCIWENVEGSFSSNGGKDLGAVLEAVIGVKEEGIEVPPPENHRWPRADVYLGTGWSVAYRLFDTKHWSRPQRRTRIYLIADFAGESAGEILFKSEGLSGYTPQGFASWKDIAGAIEKGIGAAGGLTDDGGAIAPAREIYDVRFTSEGTKNARGHCYKTSISRCLSTAESNPDSNHGGIAIVEMEPASPDTEPVYRVRRLTPVECARLQGFPDWWCSDLAIPDPTDEELCFWTEVWETWRRVTNPRGRVKTEKQIREWLSSPYTDAAEFKLWGNGCSLPIVHFVLSGIAWAASKNS